MDKTFEIIKKAYETKSLNKMEIEHLLHYGKDELFEYADKTRKEFKGNGVYLRGLVEFSNICKCHCKYCGLRCENKNIERYRLSKDEIIEIAKNGAELGYKTVVLQSGEDIFYTKDLMVEIIKEIKKLDLCLTLGVGERSYEDYKAFKDAGADRYLLRIETTDKSLYEKMHPNMSFENRLNCLKNLKKLGYETGSGILVGLPFQTVSSIADDILFFKENDFDMIGIGPFIPHPDTPLKNSSSLFDNFEMSLKVMAITRLLLPDINIPATTAMETLNPNGRLIALQSGANVVMPNITKNEFKSKYEIYPNKANLSDLDLIKTKIEEINRYVSNSKGFRFDK